MSEFEIVELINNRYNKLLSTYNQVMYLKIFVDSDDNNLIDLYVNGAKKHNDKLLNFQNLEFIDAGFDLFAPNNEGKELSTRGNLLYFYGPNHEGKSPVNKLDFKVKCAAKIIKMNPPTYENDKMDRSNVIYSSYNTGFYMYPRSSLSKTQLRLANSVGIIDAGYRGNLTGMFDVVNIKSENTTNKDTDYADYIGEAYSRYVQICAPGLTPIIVKVVKSLKDLGEATERGTGGFGSTGK